MKKEMYTKDQLEQVAQLAAQHTVKQLLQSNVNLDNLISLDGIDIKEGEDFMSRCKERLEVNGTTTWVTGKTMQELFEKAADLLKGKQTLVIENSPLFSEYENTWFHLYKEPNLRPTTFRTYKSLLEKHIIPFFGNFHLNEITTDKIQEFYNEKGELAKSSCRQMKIILSQIFDYAIENNVIQKNPTNSEMLSMSKKKKKRKALSVAQWKDIIAHLKDIDNEDDLRLLALLLFTGMRRGEVLGLRWKNVYLDTRIIFVEENITFGSGNQGTDGDPKSESGFREIPIPDKLFEILQNGGNPEHFVLGGEKHYSESKFDRAWQRLEKTVNLFGATPHILRHTYLTILGGTMTDVKTIQSIAGHSDIKITMGYVHKQADRINNAGMQITKIFCDTECDTNQTPETLTP